MTNGSLYCWGKNSYGELGIGSTTDQNTPQLVNLGSGVKAVDVSVGSGFTCAVTDAGLMCWGSNGYGRLGIGSTSPSYHSTPQNASLPTNRKAVDVQLGHVHACALLDNGDVACWGYNGAGGLGTIKGQVWFRIHVNTTDSVWNQLDRSLDHRFANHKWAMEPHPVMHIRMTSSTHHPGALLSTCRCLDSTHAAFLMMGPSHAGGSTTKVNSDLATPPTNYSRLS